MQVGPETIVTVDYTLRLDSGEIVDSSEGRDPLIFHFGRDHFNHPLAGERLNFSVTVRDVQSAGRGRIIVPGEA